MNENILSQNDGKCQEKGALAATNITVVKRATLPNDIFQTSLDCVASRIQSGSRGLAQKTARCREAYEAFLTTGDKQAYSEGKLELPAICFSGTFSRRANDALQAGSGLICIDVDGLASEAAAIRTRDELARDAHVCLAFVSPGGRGVKAVFVLSETTNAENHIFAFNTVKTYCYENYAFVIDEGCKDIARLCFFAHDAEAKVDFDAEPLPIQTTTSFQPTEPAEPAEPPPTHPTEKNEGVDSDEMLSAVSAIDPDCDYDSWIRVGMALVSELGTARGWQEFEKWSRGGAKFDEKDFYHKRAEGFRDDVKAGTIFHLARAAGWHPRRRQSRAAGVDGGGPFYENGRRVVYLNNPVTAEVTETVDRADAVFSELLQRNSEDPKIFLQGTTRVTLAWEGKSSYAKPLTKENLAARVREACKFKSVKIAKSGAVETVVSDPPRQLIEHLLSDAVAWERFPILNAIVDHPIATRTAETWTLVKRAGFDKSTGTFINAKNAINSERMPTAAAIDFLKNEVFCDFQFANAAGWANTIAYALSPILRPGFGEEIPCPIFLVTAPIHSGGKSLLATAVASALQGRVAASTNAESKLKTDAELGKYMFAEALGGTEIVCLDNLAAARGASLAVWSSEGTISDRVLGASRTERVANRMTLVVNGKNIEASTEIVDRAVRIALNPTERAKDRTFKHMTLKAFCVENRDKILSCLLSLVDDWIDRGCQLAEPKHRMQFWSAVVGGILQCDDSLSDGFLSDDDDFRKETDREYVDVSYAFEVLYAFVKTEIWTVDKATMSLLSFVQTDLSRTAGANLLADYHSTGSNFENDRARSLGIFLMKQRDARFGRLILRYAGKKRNRNGFRFEVVDGATPCPVDTDFFAELRQEYGKLF